MLSSFEAGRVRAAWAAAMACLLVLLGSLLSSGATAASPAGAPELDYGKRFITSGPGFQTLSRGQAEEFWTPERLAAARPLPLPIEGTEGERGTVDAPASRAIPGSAPFASTTVTNTTRYPARTHGRLFGQLTNGSLFTCSGTVVSSGSGSLITTAGHCLVDPVSRTAASNLVFAPAYTNGTFPYFFWPVTNAITNSPWGRQGNLNYDLAMLRVAFGGSQGSLGRLIGSRGIAFNQPDKQRYDAFGYPASGPSPDYNGENLIRCNSGFVADKARDRFHRGPASIGMRCDQQGGASGGGIVIQNSAVASVISHGHANRRGQIIRGRLYGPQFGTAAKNMYKADRPGWPSIDPVGCLGQVADFVGTQRQDKIEGGPGPDVIATLGGNDRVKGGGGRDLICGGEGPDRVIGGGAKDKIDGGEGNDRCGGAKGNDKLLDCETRRKPRKAV